MQQVIRFTNSFGEIRYGITVEREESGMVLVVWDKFAVMLARLEKRGKLNDFTTISLNMHKGWLRIASAMPGSWLELLPINFPVTWHEPVLDRAQQSAMEGNVA